MFPWGEKLIMKGPPLFFLSFNFFDVHRQRQDHSLPLSLRLRARLLSSPLICVFHGRGNGGGCFWLPPFRPGVQKKPFSASCVNNLQELPVPKLSRSSAIH